MKQQHEKHIRHFEEATELLEKMMKESHGNSLEQYKSILNRGLFLLLCAEFQNILRKILSEVIDSIEKSTGHYPHISKYIYIMGLATEIKKNSISDDNKKKNSISDDNKKLIAACIKEDKLNDARKSEFIKKTRDNIEQMPTSWKQLNKQLSESFILKLENLTYLVPTKDSHILNINIEHQSRDVFKVQDIYNQFIQIRDDYAHSNTSSILEIGISQKTDPKFKDWTFSDYKVFLKWFLEKISELL